MGVYTMRCSLKLLVPVMILAAPALALAQSQPRLNVGTPLGQDEIKSVRAFSHLPFAMIQSAAMDTSSLTSVALLRILLAELYSCHPQILSADPNLAEMLSRADATTKNKVKLAISNGQNFCITCAPCAQWAADAAAMTSWRSYRDNIYKQFERAP